MHNLDARDGKGFETGAEVETKHVSVIGHYSYQRFETTATGAEIKADTPRHKLTGGLHVQNGPLEVDLWVHSVSRTVSPVIAPAEDGYLLVNPRVGLRFKHLMFSLQAFNALDDKHLETANGRGIKGEMVGRLVTFGVRFTP